MYGRRLFYGGVAVTATPAWMRSVQCRSILQTVSLPALHHPATRLGHCSGFVITLFARGFESFYRWEDESWRSGNVCSID